MIRWLVKILFGLIILLTIWIIFGTAPEQRPYAYVRSFAAPSGNAFAAGESHLLVIAGKAAQLLIFDTETGVPAASIGEKGVQGRDDDHFADLQGVGIDRKNRHIIVCDGSNNRVQVFDAALSLVHTIGETGVKGGDEGHFRGCGSIAVDTAGGRIFVTDLRNDRIRIFDAANFAPLGAIAASAAGGLAVDEKGARLFASDARNRRVAIFSTTDGHSLGTIEKGLREPAQLVIDRENDHLLVADTGTERVAVFDLGTLAPSGAVDGFADRPGGLAAIQGKILVGDYDAEAGHDVVRIFAADPAR